jgi:hypothetical protein
MQKLKLNLQTLSNNAEVLTRSQLKNVLGGTINSSSDCVGYGTNKCSSNCPCTDHLDYCGSDYYCHRR